MNELEYISVTQYGEKYNMDVGTIRKLIADKRIKAIKIGNQWAIKSNEPRPTDMRVKSGKYKNWRKKDAKYKKANNGIKEKST